jgi:hypothetical protein
MNATCKISSIELIATPPLWSRTAYLFQGNPVTAAVLKIKAFFYAFKTTSPRPPPGPGGREDPPEIAELEDYWNDPMLWMLILH